MQEASFFLEIEQDVYLVQRSMIDLRPDLKQCGCMVLGAPVELPKSVPDPKKSALLEEFKNAARLMDVDLSITDREIPGHYTIVLAPRSIDLCLVQQKLYLRLIQEASEHHSYEVLTHQKPIRHQNGSSIRCRISLWDQKKKDLRELEFLQPIIALVDSYMLNEYDALLRAVIDEIDPQNVLSFKMMAGAADIAWSVMVILATFVDSLEYVVGKLEHSFEEKKDKSVAEILNTLQLHPVSAAPSRSNPWASMVDSKTERLFSGVLSLDGLKEQMKRFIDHDINQMNGSVAQLIDLVREKIIPAIEDRLANNRSIGSLDELLLAIGDLELHYHQTKGLKEEALSRCLRELILPRMERVQKAAELWEPLMYPYWPLPSVSRILGGAS